MIAMLSTDAAAVAMCTETTPRHIVIDAAAVTAVAAAITACSIDGTASRQKAQRTSALRTLQLVDCDP